MIELQQSRNPILFFVNGIGDHLINLPAIRALAQIFEGRLTLICHERLAFLFEEIPLRELKALPMDRADSGWVFDLAPISRDHDLFMSLVPWHTPFLEELIAHSGVNVTIGYHHFFSHYLKRDYSIHSCDLTFQLPQTIQPHLRIETFSTEPPESITSQEFGDAVFSKLNNRRVLALHTQTLQEKMWHTSGWRACLDRFLERFSSFIVLSLDYQPNQLDEGDYASKIIPVTDLGIEKAFALLARADLFLGVDSCMLHVADLHKIPGVALFGPTSPHEFGYRFAKGTHVSAPTMAEIKVDDVIQALFAQVIEMDANA